LKTGDWGGRELTKLCSGRHEKILDCNPLVTIVTPSYNQGRFIEETILSVLTQDYPAIEYLVMDGGSTDETLEILKKYSGRLEFVSEKDRGQSHAINKGFRRARGEILAFLNSDDTYLPGAVRAAVKSLCAAPEAPFLYGEGYHIDERGRILDRYPTEGFSYERFHDTCFVCQPTVFIRRTALEIAGYLDENLHYCMDYELWIRLAKVGRPVHIDRSLANSRLHAATKTMGQRRACHWEIAQMWKRLERAVPTNWVFGLAHAIVETRLKLNRSKPAQNASFVLILSLLSTLLFLRFNHGLRREESARIREWLGSVFRGAGRLLLKT
jgi:glycosyltransferase involved in cell wall biosynthesis